MFELGGLPEFCGISRIKNMNDYILYNDKPLDKIKGSLCSHTDSDTVESNKFQGPHVRYG